MSRPEDYIQRVQAVLGRVSTGEIHEACDLLEKVVRRDGGIYLCGNGGSAATASHWAVDLGKNLQPVVGQRVRVISLTDNVPYLTALANDLSFDDCFAEQLRNHVRPSDLVIGISASGDSENVVRAFRLAQDYGADRLALVGFDGGRLARMATVSLWIDSYDYGIVESLHMILAHLLVRMIGDRARVATPGGDVRHRAGGDILCEQSCHKLDIPVAVGDRREIPAPGAES